MNEKGGTPPAEHRFQAGDDPKRNPGGRTPTAWLRKLLDAAHDKSPEGRSRREAIALHLIEVATSYEVVVKGRGEDAIPLASAKDSIEAAKVLYAYDMGKPVESIEVKNPDGPRVLFYLPTKDGQPSALAAAPEQPPTGSDDGSGSAGH